MVLATALSAMSVWTTGLIAATSLLELTSIPCELEHSISIKAVSARATRISETAVPIETTVAIDNDRRARRSIALVDTFGWIAEVTFRRIAVAG